MALDLQSLAPGRQLRVRRVAAGLRLFDVAMRTGIPEPRLSEVERGVRDLPGDELARIEAALIAAETPHAG